MLRSLGDIGRSPAISLCISSCDHVIEVTRKSLISGQAARDHSAKIVTDAGACSVPECGYLQINGDCTCLVQVLQLDGLGHHLSRIEKSIVAFEVLETVDAATASLKTCIKPPQVYGCSRPQGCRRSIVGGKLVITISECAQPRPRGRIGDDPFDAVQTRPKSARVASGTVPSVYASTGAKLTAHSDSDSHGTLKREMICALRLNLQHVLLESLRAEPLPEREIFFSRASTELLRFALSSAEASEERKRVLEKKILEIDVTSTSVREELFAFQEEVDRRAQVLKNWLEFEVGEMPAEGLTCPSLATLLRKRAPRIYAIIAAWVQPDRADDLDGEAFVRIGRACPALCCISRGHSERSGSSYAFLWSLITYAGEAIGKFKDILTALRWSQSRDGVPTFLDHRIVRTAKRDFDMFEENPELAATDYLDNCVVAQGQAFHRIDRESQNIKSFIAGRFIHDAGHAHGLSRNLPRYICVTPGHYHHGTYAELAPGAKPSYQGKTLTASALSDLRELPTTHAQTKGRVFCCGGPLALQFVEFFTIADLMVVAPTWLDVSKTTPYVHDPIQTEADVFEQCEVV